MEEERSGGKLGRRCSMCGITWPPALEFATCCECGEKTDLCRTHDGPTLTEDEAISKLRAHEFQEYLEREGIE